MARRRTTVGIISLSAIDLFASTLGAFVIFTAILIPYYPNMKDGAATTHRLKAEITVEREEAAALADQLEKLTVEERSKLDALVRAEKAAATRRSLAGKTVDLKRANDAAAREVGRLRSQLDALKTEVSQQPEPVEEPTLTDFSVLGITTEAKKLLILVDLSGSMEAWSKTLVDTVSEIIDPFQEDIRFAILGFQDRGVTRHWPRARGRMAIGDAAGKADAKAFIQRIPNWLGGGTPTQTALRTALFFTDQPDAIILVSDGAPIDAEPVDIVRRISGINRGKTEIHTVAVGAFLENRQLIEFLNDLAKQNGGQFVGVLND
jgi:hypothetical protein